MKKFLKIIPLLSLFLVSCGKEDKPDTPNENTINILADDVANTISATYTKVKEGAVDVLFSVKNGELHLSTAEETDAQVIANNKVVTKYVNVTNIGFDLKISARNLDQKAPNWQLGVALNVATADLSIRTSSSVITISDQIRNASAYAVLANDKIYVDLSDPSLVTTLGKLTSLNIEAIDEYKDYFGKKFYINNAYSIISGLLKMTGIIDSQVNFSELIKDFTLPDLPSSALEEVKTDIAMLPLEIAQLPLEFRNMFSFNCKESGEYGVGLKAEIADLTTLIPVDTISGSVAAECNADFVSTGLLDKISLNLNLDLKIDNSEYTDKVLTSVDVQTISMKIAPKITMTFGGETLITSTDGYVDADTIIE